MVNHHLHWDDHDSWPNPWDLLADNIWCDVARGLGIVYTILLCDPQSRTELDMLQTENDNLVSVDNGKYILNWAPRQILNIHSTNITVRRKINGDRLFSLLG